MDCELPVCREHFERIDARLQELESSQKGQQDRFGEMAVQTARMHEKLNIVDASLRSVTRALWSVTASAVALLVGFVFWYIQGV